MTAAKKTVVDAHAHPRHWSYCSLQLLQPTRRSVFIIQHAHRIAAGVLGLRVHIGVMAETVEANHCVPMCV